LLLLSSVTGIAADAPPALQLSVAGSTVRIANVTSGGDVVLFSASLANDRGVLRQRSAADVLHDDDGDGVVTFQSATPIPLRSIWIAVDETNGQSAIGGRADYAPTILPFPQRLVKQDADGIIGIFGDERLAAEMVIVRPGKGAWRLVALDGETTDGDRQHDGRLSLAAADAQPLDAKSETPKRLKNGDVIAVIDPDRMECFVTEVGK
jgi:hypothetical protein